MTTNPTDYRLAHQCLFVFKSRQHKKQLRLVGHAIVKSDEKVECSLSDAQAKQAKQLEHMDDLTAWISVVVLDSGRSDGNVHSNKL
jgi:hypothetical protein